LRERGRGRRKGRNARAQGRDRELAQQRLGWMAVQIGRPCRFRHRNAPCCGEDQAESLCHRLPLVTSRQPASAGLGKSPKKWGKNLWRASKNKTTNTYVIDIAL
jgi:hypothetical protein